MTSSIYEQLMDYKQWANAGLYAVVADSLHRLQADDRAILMQILDHMHAVDGIFRHHLLAQPHDYGCARSPVRPDFETLAAQVRALDDWYTGYAATLAPAEADEVIAFRFTSGTQAQMRRGDILLHVALHGTYHRGNAGLLLQKNGVKPNDDRFTDLPGISPAMPIDSGARTAPLPTGA
ncbi:DinB family protein [Sphingopyxis sp.]|jgi:uncharacterized damage-inducible protein DinB|uniref:DinB family protein n=1 Tax=Sphingopyxis sp. TaxID=1908224 RepID=UPI003F7111A7